MDLRHEKVVAYYVTFGTNDKKILSLISLQCFIFSGSTWYAQLMNILLVAIPIVYAHGL